MMTVHCEMEVVNVAGLFTASTGRFAAARLLNLWVRIRPMVLKSALPVAWCCQV